MCPGNCLCSHTFFCEFGNRQIAFLLHRTNNSLWFRNSTKWLVMSSLILMLVLSIGITHLKRRTLKSPEVSFVIRAGVKGRAGWLE